MRANGGTYSQGIIKIKNSKGFLFPYYSSTALSIINSNSNEELPH